MNVQLMIRHSLGACVFGVFCTSIVLASPVKITIEPSGNMGGFGFSLIHAASSQSGSFPGYYTGGSELYNNISGMLLGDLTGTPGSLALANIMGVLTTDIVGGGGSATFNITGGSLAQQANGFVDGTLDYLLTGGPNPGSGTFYFDAINFMNNSTGPNRLTQTTLVLWGNNWDKEGGALKPYSGGLGVDLKGNVEPIPEPATVILLGSGLAGLVAWRYRKTQG